MKLGGFVIHGNNVETLPACLESLRSVCDEVVAVDSHSTDGSAAVVREDPSVHRIVFPWQGYGAARATAAQRLHELGCDWQFYLDSDEWLEDEARRTLKAWKTRPDVGRAQAYAVYRSDWAYLRDGGRFLFRRTKRKRLFSKDLPTWTPRMIVHEAIHGSAEFLPLHVEHRFAVDWEERGVRNDGYALLWAIQAHAEGRTPKPQGLQRVAHSVKGAVVDGAFLRGGLNGAKLSWLTSRYHARKHELLRRVRQGEFAELSALYSQGQLEELFRAVSKLPPFQ